MKRIQFVIFVFIHICFCSCGSKYLSTPPIPNEKMDVTSEMKHIEKTDQTDRKKGFIHIIFSKKKRNIISERDSIRATRVYELYTKGLIKTDKDKFTTGLVLMHSSIDGHGKLAYEVFSDLEKNGTTDGAKKTGEYWRNLVVKEKIYIPESEDENGRLNPDWSK